MIENKNERQQNKEGIAEVKTLFDSDLAEYEHIQQTKATKAEVETEAQKKS